MAFKACLRVSRLSVLVLAFGLPAFAQEQSSTPYELHPKTDLTTFGVAGGLALGSLFLHPKYTCYPKGCPASDVNGFDRGTTTRNSSTIDKISTGAAVAAAGWPVAAIFFDAGKSKDALTDSLVTGQAVVLDVALNQWVKLAVHRPRPFVYGLQAGNELLTKNDSYYSFYSQHTSVAFAAGISYARTYALRHPTSRRRWLVYTAAIGGASAVGSMRVLAGKHFPTDVITGAAAGAGMGLLVPWLHQKGTIPGLTALPVPSGAAVSLRVPFGN